MLASDHAYTRPYVILYCCFVLLKLEIYRYNHNLKQYLPVPNIIIQQQATFLYSKNLSRQCHKRQQQSVLGIRDIVKLTCYNHTVCTVNVELTAQTKYSGVKVCIQLSYLLLTIIQLHRLHKKNITEASHNRYLFKQIILSCLVVHQYLNKL